MHYTIIGCAVNMNTNTNLSKLRFDIHLEFVKHLHKLRICKASTQAYLS